MLAELKGLCMFLGQKEKPMKLNTYSSKMKLNMYTSFSHLFSENGDKK